MVHQLNVDEVSDWLNENTYIVINNGQRINSPDKITKWPNYKDLSKELLDSIIFKLI